MTSKYRFQDELATRERRADSTTISSTTTTTVDTVPGVFSEQDKRAVYESYRQNIGDRMPGVLAAYITRLISGGMCVGNVIHAIEITGWARRPSAAYLKAVLRRYQESEILTFRDLMADEDEHERILKAGREWWKPDGYRDEDLPF